MWLAELIGHSKQYFTSSHMGSNLCHLQEHYCSVQREWDNWPPLGHLAILIHSSRESWLRWVLDKDRDIANHSVGLHHWQRSVTSSGLSPAAEDLFLHPYLHRTLSYFILLFRLLILHEIFSFSFWIFTALWQTPVHFPTQHPNVADPWGYLKFSSFGILPSSVPTSFDHHYWTSLHRQWGLRLQRELCRSPCSVLITVLGIQ